MTRQYYNTPGRICPGVFFCSITIAPKTTKPKAVSLGFFIIYALERNEFSILVISLENF